MEISIFGASKLGELAFIYLKKNNKVNFFIDNARNKQGEKKYGLDIISISDYNFSKGGEIVIASQYNYEIASQLIDLGIKKFGVYEKGHYEEIKFYDYSNKKFIFGKLKVALLCDNNSGSNTLALYNYLKKTEEFKNKVILIDVKNKNKSYYYDLITSNIIFKTHEGTNIEGKINIQLWHGFPYKTLGSEKVIATDTEVKLKRKEWSKLKTTISYSEIYSDLMNCCYNNEKFEITGMPRNDLLFDSDGKNNLNNLLKIKNKKIIMYMPTFRESYYGEENGGEHGYLFNSNDFSAKEFNDYLIKENLIFIYKLHPYDIKEFKGKFKEYSNILDLNDYTYEKDLYEFINGVDILVTDYSSIYFDYLLLDKPIIFYVPDKDEYVKNRGVLLNPFNFWMVGDKTINLKALIRSIDVNLKEDKYLEKRNIIKNIVHKYIDNKASFRIYEYLKRVIKESD